MSYQEPQDPFSPQIQTSPPKRRPRIWLVALLGVGLAAAIITLAVVVPKALRGLEEEPTPSSSPSFAPVRVALSESATCVRLIPAAQAGADAVTGIVKQPDGSTVDWPKLRTTISDLKTIKDSAPPDMAADIDGQIKVLEHMIALADGTGRGRLELEEYRNSGLRIATRCARHATG